MWLCLALTLGLQSCDDNDGYSVDSFTPPLWATVRTTSNAFYLDCDAYGTMWPVNTGLGWYEAMDGQRVITVVTPLADNYGDYDYAVKILRLQEVLTKGVETLTPENEAEFGNDPVFIYKQDMGISGGYLNIIFQQNLPMGDVRHRISLVRPQATEADADDGYIHLELRYNNYDSLSGIRRPGAVSFNLNTLDITPETKGIKLTLNSEVNGEGVEVTYELNRSEGAPEPPASVDLSEMRLE